MAFRNLVTVNGKDIELKELPEKERQRLVDYWNRKAAEAVNYKEVKTA